MIIRSANYIYYEKALLMHSRQTQNLKIIQRKARQRFTMNSKHNKGRTERPQGPQLKQETCPKTTILTFPPCCSWFVLLSWASPWLSHPLHRTWWLPQKKPLAETNPSSSSLVNPHSQISLQFEAGWIFLLFMLVPRFWSSSQNT